MYLIETPCMFLVFNFASTSTSHEEPLVGSQTNKVPLVTQPRKLKIGAMQLSKVTHQI